MKGRKPTARRSVTLRDVARAAGVSVMTVSNFMNGKFQFMGKATRQRVARAAERLDYRPSANARGLRRAERRSIGMIVIDDQPAYLTDPFITYVVAGLSNFLSSHGYALVLQGLSPRQLAGSPIVTDVLTDGICVMLSGSDAARRACLGQLLDLRQPVLAFQEKPPRKQADLCVICQDDRRGGELLGAHLIAKGAHRLAMLVPHLIWPAIREREAGIRRAITATGADARLEFLDCGDVSMPETQSALARYIKTHGLPDAVVAGNDQMGIAALKLFREQGVAVPGRVLVTGFNAFEFWHYSDPLLTTVRSAAYEIGVKGGEAMVDRLQRGAFRERGIVLPVELLLGGST